MYTNGENMIHIALGTDDNYCKYAGCCIASILLSAEKEDAFCFYVVDNGISEKNRARLENLQKLRAHELIFLKPDMQKLQDLPQCSYLGLSAYLRLLLPELLPDLDHLIYLDCDMIVTRSLWNLWTIDLQSKAIGVVEDYVESLKGARSVAKILGLGFYFNSGMLLLDLKQIRERALFREVLAWTVANPEKVKFGDQDGLNVIFKDNYVEISPNWNIQISPFPLEHQRLLDEGKQTAIKQNLGIIHFISSPKPDKYFYMASQKVIFEDILSKTPWACELEKPTLALRLKKLIKGNRLYQWYRIRRICVKNWLRSKIGKGGNVE